MTLRRLLPFILINVFISAAVVVAVLTWWDSRQPEAPAVAPPAPLATAGAAAIAPLPVDSELQLSFEETPVPVEEEEEGPPVYAVQAGDTLGRIAEQFDVPVADIMATNGLDNPNFISVGQLLIIPVGGLATPTPPATEAPVEPTPLPTVTSAFAQGEVRVTLSEVTGVGVLTEESVLITNLGSQAVNLGGWTIADQSGQVYTFAVVTLFGDGAGIRLHTEAGADSATDLFWGVEQAIWEIGETVTLRDAEGALRAELVIVTP